MNNRKKNLTKRLLVPSALSLAVASNLTSAQTRQEEFNRLAVEYLEIVVVSGEKIDRSFQETLSSVALKNASDIEDSTIENLFDILDITANTGTSVSGTGRSENINIRGSGSAGIGTGGVSQVITVFVDGAPVDKFATSLNSSFDVERVEILRGPQSTIQGRNTLMGAVVIKTKDPTEEFKGRARIAFGESGSEELALAVGGPINDSIGFRLTAQQRNSDGFEQDINGNDTDSLDSQLYRGKVNFKITDKLNALITFAASEEEEGIPLIDEDRVDDRVTSLDIISVADRENQMASIKVDYNINGLWNFTSLTAHSDSEEKDISDQDGLALPLDSLGNPVPIETYAISPNRVSVDDFTNFVQEFRFVYEGTDNTRAIVGAYFGTRKNERDDLIQIITPLQFSGLDTLLGPGLESETDLFRERTFETMALFGQIDYVLNENWTLIGGLRIESEEVDIDLTQVQTAVEESDRFILDVNPAVPVAPGVNLPLRDVVVGALGGFDVFAPLDADSSETFNVVLPKVGVAHNSDNGATYAFSVQEAYRPGGIDLNPLGGFIYSYDEESSWNYEFAYRQGFADDKILVNANVFFIDWEDQQQQVLNSNGGGDFDIQTRNLASSELRGLDLEIIAAPSNAWRWFASIGLLDTEIKESALINGIDITGNSFAFAPEFSAGVGVTYTNPNGIIVSIDGRYEDESESSIDGTGAKQDSRAIFNARIAYVQDWYEVFAYGRNIFDEDYLVNADAIGNQVVAGAPSVFGAGVEISF